MQGRRITNYRCVTLQEMKAAAENVDKIIHENFKVTGGCSGVDLRQAGGRWKAAVRLIRAGVMPARGCARMVVGLEIPPAIAAPGGHEFGFFTEGNEVKDGASRAAWLGFYDSLARGAGNGGTSFVPFIVFCANLFSSSIPSGAKLLRFLRCLLFKKIFSQGQAEISEGGTSASIKNHFESFGKIPFRMGRNRQTRLGFCRCRTSGGCFLRVFRCQSRSCQRPSVSRSRHSGRREMGSWRVRMVLRPPVKTNDSQSMTTTTSPM